MTDHVDTFRDEIFGVATLHEAAAAEVADTIADIVETPAVGTPLPFEGVSLPDTVETDFSPRDLETAKTGVTPARYAIATYGTVVLPSDADGTELASLYPPTHVAVVAASDVLPDMQTAYERLGEDIGGAGVATTTATETSTDGAETPTDPPASQILATGPSATADMGTLVEGVHGPDEVHVLLVTDR